MSLNLIPANHVKLDFDFTPLPLWGHSPAVLVGLDRWKPIREQLIESVGGKCQVCQGLAFTDHAVWEYEDNLRFDDYTGVRTLLGFEVLCALCMSVRHTALRSKYHVSTRQLIDHYCRINDVGYSRFIARYTEAIQEQAKRNLVDWQEDVSLLVRMGLAL
jgi:hypothetical protein